MIRGALEYVGKNEISGWLYSSEIELKGRLVLAFLDARCIGAGQIEIVRDDLFSAQLGDGYYGFRFAVVIPDGADLGAVAVRLENSDLSLIQKMSRVSV